MQCSTLLSEVLCNVTTLAVATCKQAKLIRNLAMRQLLLIAARDNLRTPVQINGTRFESLEAVSRSLERIIELTYTICRHEAEADPLIITMYQQDCGSPVPDGCCHHDQMCEWQLYEVGDVDLSLTDAHDDTEFVEELRAQEKAHEECDPCAGPFYTGTAAVGLPSAQSQSGWREFTGQVVIEFPSAQSQGG